MMGEIVARNIDAIMSYLISFHTPIQNKLTPYYKAFIKKLTVS